MRIDLLLLLLLLAGGASSPTQLEETLECLRGYMDSFSSKMDGKLFQMFRASYPNTLTTTVQHFDLTPGQEETYIITGDIEAMWLRDSTNQFLPYMKITVDCPHIRSLAQGLLNTQAELLMTDSYTNAFKRFEAAHAQRHSYLNDKTEALFFGIPVDLARHREFATKAIWERKFELDSLASFLRLAYEYHQRYDTLALVNVGFIKALKRLMRTVEEQSKDTAYEKRRKQQFYTFYRTAAELRDGKIMPSFGTGMIKTGFRPSDDPNDLGYNIPGNAMLSTYLALVASEILAKLPETSVFQAEASILGNRMLRSSETIREAIFEFGVVKVEGREVFAYEVNGKGQSKTFDDANLPSLLSLSYLKFVGENNEVYQNTRKHILSKSNPYFYQAGSISGIGSSHTPHGNIWPLALITQALTSRDSQEIKRCLESLKSHSTDNLMHESFSVTNPRSNTRAWFAWANSLFGQMVITLAKEDPDTLK